MRGWRRRLSSSALSCSVPVEAGVGAVPNVIRLSGFRMGIGGHRPIQPGVCSIPDCFGYWLCRRSLVAEDCRVSLFPDCVGSLGAIFLRSEEHTSELQSLMRISYAVFCLKKKKTYMMTIDTE